jgi:hypothetical protein
LQSREYSVADATTGERDRSLLASSDFGVRKYKTISALVLPQRLVGDTSNVALAHQ